MHEVGPRNGVLLGANPVDLISKPVDEALNGIGDEIGGLGCATGFTEFPVVLISGQVVVVGKEMGSRQRHHLGPSEDEELEKPGGSPVPVSKRMNPGDVEMGVDSACSRKSKLDLGII